MNSAFYKENRRKLMERAADDSVLISFSGTAVQATADEDYPFHPNRNFYYLTGLTSSKIVLLMTKRDGRVEETLFIEPVDAHVEKWLGKMLTVIEAQEISGVEDIAFISQFETRLHRLLSAGDCQNLYLDLERRAWGSPQTQVQLFATETQAKYPQVQVKDFYPEVALLRTIKSLAEVDSIREAIRITDLGIQSILQHAEPGIMEYQLEAHFDYALKMSGAKPAYPSIVGSGKNATIMHYTENANPVPDGELVLVDLGAEYKYYKADITRTFPISGEFQPRQRALYELVLKAELDTIEMIKPGIEHRKLNEMTRRVLADGLKDMGVIQEDKELDRYFFYNVSHYLGLDTHDVGPYDVLRPGMVLTIEPGVYIPEESTGIRIEDDVLVTETGYEVLSKDIIKTVEDIETFMANTKAEKQAHV